MHLNSDGNKIAANGKVKKKSVGMKPKDRRRLSDAAAGKLSSAIAHAAQQNHKDRMVDTAGHDSRMFVQLAKIPTQIVSSQLKGDPNANAGQLLREDVEALEGHESNLHERLDSLTRAIGELSKPHVFDGRQVRIE